MGADGARGGRAQARNRRFLQFKQPQQVPIAAQLEAPLETAAEAIAALDAQFPWLHGAEKRRYPRGATAPGTALVADGTAAKLSGIAVRQPTLGVIGSKIIVRPPGCSHLRTRRTPESCVCCATPRTCSAAYSVLLGHPPYFVRVTSSLALPIPPPSSDMLGSPVMWSAESVRQFVAAETMDVLQIEIATDSLSCGDFGGCAGLNRHIVGNARVLQERRERIHLGPKPCG